ncbi:hypothetical protein ACFQWF_07595 [Methylorubrum suomiense]
MRGARAAVLAVAASLALLAPPAIAGPETAPPVRAVVEMFTSQGCSACLPADRLTGSSAANPACFRSRCR